MKKTTRIQTQSNYQPLALIFFLFLSSSLPVQAQYNQLTYDQAVAVFGERIFEFRRFSLELTDESKNELLELVETIQKFPAVLASNVIIVQTFTCEKELNVKPYIAACRGQVLIDYLVEELHMPRKMCFIQDGGPNRYDPECEVLSSVNVYLKPAW
ncbi:MAG: hypothetical protein AAFQ87_15915 [Bacteroidota bacterium]